jgi:hypothetical protein
VIKREVCVGSERNLKGESNVRNKHAYFMHGQNHSGGPG